MEKIKLYISNYNLLKNEKTQTVKFLCKFSDMLEKTYNRGIEILTCEKGEDYHEKIRQSDLCVFLCNKKNVRQLTEEFLFANEAYENDVNRKKIFTFFKRSVDDTSDECKDFKVLHHVAGYCYSVFENFDEIKFRLICAIKFGFMEYIEIEDRREKGCVDGHEFFNIEKLPELKNNQAFNKRKEDLEKTKTEWQNLSALMKERELTVEELKRHKDLIMKEKWYRNQVLRAHAQIFRASLNAMKYWIQGKACYTLCKAYQEFFAGNLDGALEYVAYDEIIKEFKALKSTNVRNPAKVEQCTYKALASIDIDIIKNGQNKEGSAYKLFECVLLKALEYSECAEFVFRYMKFMSDVDENKKAVEAYEEFQEIHFWYDVDFTDEIKMKKAAAYAYRRIKRMTDAEECFIRQLLKYKELIRESEEYVSNYALSFFDLGEYYFGVGKREKALEYYKAALQLNGKLYNNNPEKYIPNLAYANYKVSIITEDKEYARRAYNLADQQPNSPTCAIVITMLAINFDDIDDDE